MSSGQIKTLQDRLKKGTHAGEEPPFSAWQFMGSMVIAASFGLSLILMLGFHVWLLSVNRTTIEMHSPFVEDIMSYKN